MLTFYCYTDDPSVFRDYGRASKAHDVDQMLWRLGKVLEEET